MARVSISVNGNTYEIACADGEEQHILDLAGILDGRVDELVAAIDRKSTRLNSSHRCSSYAVSCLKKKKNKESQAYYRDINPLDECPLTLRPSMGPMHTFSLIIKLRASS